MKKKKRKYKKKITIRQKWSTTLKSQKNSTIVVFQSKEDAF